MKRFFHTFSECVKNIFHFSCLLKLPSVRKKEQQHPPEERPLCRSLKKREISFPPERHMGSKESQHFPEYVGGTEFADIPRAVQARGRSPASLSPGKERKRILSEKRAKMHRNNRSRGETFGSHKKRSPRLGGRRTRRSRRNRRSACESVRVFIFLKNVSSEIIEKARALSLSLSLSLWCVRSVFETEGERKKQNLGEGKEN